MSDDSEEEEGGGGGWLVSYADLMTLLFAAFVVLYGITPEGKSDSILGMTARIRESFVEVPDIIAMENQEDSLKFGKFVANSFTGEVKSTPDPTYSMRKEDPKVAFDMDKNVVDNLLDQIAADSNEDRYNLRRNMVAEPGEKGFTIKLMGAYFYDSGSHRLSREGRTRLLRLGKLLRTMGRKLVIEGHTDADSGNIEYSNEILGSLRAAEAAHLLIRDLGMSPIGIRTVSYGADRPLSNDGTSEAKARNRRIEIKVLPGRS